MESRRGIPTGFGRNSIGFTSFRNFSIPSGESSSSLWSNDSQLDCHGWGILFAWSKSTVFRFLPIFHLDGGKAEGESFADFRFERISSYLWWTSSLRREKGIYVYICFIYGEVFLDSRGFTVKLARYTVEGFFYERERGVGKCRHFRVQRLDISGIRRMKNARCVTLPFLDFCLAGNREEREREGWFMRWNW